MELYKIIEDTEILPAGIVGYIKETGKEEQTGLTMFYPLRAFPIYRTTVELTNLERID